MSDARCTEVRRPILIFGPTAGGKSALALRLAERLDGEVINADALQVYAGWRVLTARPDAADEARAPHRLYGHVPVSQAHSTGHWLREAVPAIAAAQAAGRTPIVVGGSGLLFAALTEGLAEIPETPPEIRAATEKFLQFQGVDALSRALRARDPATWARLDAANPRRLARAWEVLETTGKGLAAWQAETPPPAVPPSRSRPLRLIPPVPLLEARIAARFDAMLAAGALDEARRMAAAQASPQALQALGAAELFAHLRGEIPLAEARARAILATRRYAKRQRTWARNRLSAWPLAAHPDQALALLATAPPSA